MFMTLFSVLTSVASARGTRKDLQGVITQSSIGRDKRSWRVAENVVQASAGAGQQIDGSDREGRVGA
jgi:hypothetical protein